jgi:hypothetical protein
MLFDHLDTPENWKRVTNTDLVVGDLVLVNDRESVVTGFGPYFIWARPCEEPETPPRRTASWKEVEL